MPRISLDKDIFCSAGWDSRLRVYGFENNTITQLAVINCDKFYHTGTLQAIAGNGKLMATGCTDGKIAIWKDFTNHF